MRTRIVAVTCLVVVAAACGKVPAGRPPVPQSAESPSPGSPQQRTESRLLYATKAGRTVTVRAVGLRTRTEKTLFVYDEPRTAEHSGNYWEEQPPSIAFSAATALIAYGAADGLHVYDLVGKSTRTLVKRVALEVREEDRPPVWSPPVEDTYGFYNLAWSGDGRYLSFDESRFEGSKIGFFDLAADSHFYQARMPFSYVEPSLRPAAWAREDASSIVSASGTDFGLFLSAPNDPARGALLRLPYNNVGVAALSPDGAEAAFLFARDDSYPGSAPMDGVAVVRRDGASREVLDDAGIKSWVTFDADGDVLWVEGGTVHRRHGSSTIVAARVDDDYEWEILSADAKTLALAGRSETRGRGLFLLLDRATGKAEFMHAAATDYVTFLGVV